jgi:small subunit ribosomal protein S20
MANTRSAKKAARQTLRRTAVNKIRRTKMRSIVRKAEEALEGKDATVAAQSVMMKSVKTGTIHKNTAARKTSRMAARLKKIAAAA